MRAVREIDVNSLKKRVASGPLLFFAQRIYGYEIILTPYSICIEEGFTSGFRQPTLISLEG